MWSIKNRESEGTIRENATLHLLYYNMFISRNYKRDHDRDGSTDHLGGAMQRCAWARWTDIYALISIDKYPNEYLHKDLSSSTFVLVTHICRETGRTPNARAIGIPLIFEIVIQKLKIIKHINEINEWTKIQTLRPPHRMTHTHTHTPHAPHTPQTHHTHTHTHQHTHTHTHQHTPTHTNTHTHTHAHTHTTHTN